MIFTLAATRKFRDSLTGRKQAIHLCLVLWDECAHPFGRRDRVDTVECKTNPDRVNAAPVEGFRSLYPQGDNYVVSPSLKQLYRIRRGELVFTVCTTKDLS